MNLNILNPKQLEYQTEKLHLSVLGGINFQHFDRLRVTIKAMKPESHFGVRHSLDLYHDGAVEKLTRRIAEQLEIGTSIVRKSLYELTNLLEAYRLEHSESTSSYLMELSEKESEEARKLLESKNLIEKTKDLIKQSGVIGEEKNSLLMYLIFTSRKTNHPLHCISIAQSNNKNELQNSIAQLMPEEDLITITSLSSSALYYFGKTELNHKIILLEDLDGAEKAQYPIKELQTRQKLIKTTVHKLRTGENQTIQRVIEAKTTLAGCTSKENSYQDHPNRSFILYLDESHEQEQRTIEYQQKSLAGKTNLAEEQEAKRQLQNAQRLLENVSIRNPYAELLLIPQSVFRSKQTNLHYLYLINTITFYHQYQRKKQIDTETGEECIETTIDDIKTANELIKDTLLLKSDDLTANCRAYYDKITELTKEREPRTFTGLELRKLLRLPKATQWRYHKQLLDFGYIERKGRINPALYELKSRTEYEDWETNIDEILNQNIKKIEELEQKATKTEQKPIKTIRNRPNQRVAGHNNIKDNNQQEIK